MEKVISSTRLKSDPLARGIIDYLSSQENKLNLEDSVLYYDFPIFRDYEERLYQPSLLLLDKNRGIYIIRVAGTALEIEKEDILLGELHSLLYAKLLNSKQLRKNRSSLKIEINSLLYLPPGQDSFTHEIESTQVSSYEGLFNNILESEHSKLSDDDFSEARSVIEGVKALTKNSFRNTSDSELKSKALVIKKLEEEIANFDTHQRRAALTVATGPQRIRGLAGSGKTIILAWKAAQIHLENPEKKILFTFYTKSLYDTIRKQVTRFYRHFKDSDPNWKNLQILHAWGGRREAGVYFNACIDNNSSPKSWSEVQFSKNPFQTICQSLIENTSIKEKYDVVLVDEAQDMPDSFFTLLFYLTKGHRDEKSIIWAYDELQSIFEPRMRTPEELFGYDKDKQPRISLDRSAKHNSLGEYFSNDLVLYKCYRNPLDVLVCSHALGLGIYGANIVQMLEDKDHWEDVGYEVKEGSFATGSQTIIERPIKNSPLAILNYEKKEELIKLHASPDLHDECNWVLAQILEFISEGVRPEEILVICLDDRNAKSYFSLISTLLSSNNIGSNNLLANPLVSNIFSSEGRVTLSTVHRAKGNEAPLVFAIGIDAITPELNSRRGRNKLFTAFTRTKCWLRVSGFASNSNAIFNEIQLAASKSPQLIFTWPNLPEVDMLQRDMSKREDNARKIQKEYLKRMAELGFSEDDAFAELEVPEKKL